MLRNDFVSGINETLFDIATTYDMRSIINEPTRVTETSSSQLDYILCDENMATKRKGTVLKLLRYLSFTEGMFLLISQL